MLGHAHGERMPRKVVPAMFAGLCPVCAGSGLMPRSAPELAQVSCESCDATGVVR